MRRVILAFSLLLFASACGLPSQWPGQPPTCARLVGTALGSPDHAVPGSFACLTGVVRIRLLAIGHGNDDGLRLVAAAEPRTTRSHFLGQLVDGEWAWELDQEDHSIAIAFLHVDQAGKVDHIHIAA